MCHLWVAQANLATSSTVHQFRFSFCKQLKAHTFYLCKSCAKYTFSIKLHGIFRYELLDKYLHMNTVKLTLPFTSSISYYFVINYLYFGILIKLCAE